jgi:hypothetical protein
MNRHPIWMFLLPSALMGIGQAGMWGPLATTATRNLGRGRRRRRGHLQHDAHDRVGARLGRDRRVHAGASRGEPAGRLDAGGDFGAGSCPTSSSAGSRMPWRSRCCCPPPSS